MPTNKTPEPSKGKLPTNKPVHQMSPSDMESGFVRAEDLMIYHGRFYIVENAPVTPKPSAPHGFVIPIQNVDCARFVIELRNGVHRNIENKEPRCSTYAISGVSYPSSDMEERDSEEETL